MFRRAIKEISAEFPAEGKYLDSIQRTVRESCISASMPRKDISAVMLAIEEGATNIIRHAYLYDKGTIRLRIIIYKKLIVFSLIDFGRSFKPNRSGTLDLKHLIESGRKGGLGFFMIQKIMDSVEYISTAAFNELRMIKRIKDKSSGGRQLFKRMLTLRVKFSIWTYFIMSVIIGVSIYYFDFKTTQGMHLHVDETVKALGTTIADQAAGYIINNRSDVEFDEMIVSYKRANPEILQIVLTDQNNLILAHSDLLLDIRTLYNPPDKVDISKINESQELSDIDKQQFFVILPIQIGDRVAGKVNIVYTIEVIQEQLSQARKMIVMLTFILVVFGIFGIYILSSYFVSPILKITHRVRQFASGDLETELPLEGAEEFFEISKAFNEMITRLSQDRKNIAEREKLAKEIEVASEIQNTLLPAKFPTIPNLEIDSFYRAASVVGGDLYDVFQVGDDKYCLVVADVSGKGVPASLVMSMLKTVIQINAQDSFSAKEILVKVNTYLSKNIPPGVFVTVFLGLYISNKSKLQVVSAGHNPMLFYQAANNELSRVNPKGMPLGIPVLNSNAFQDKLEEIELSLKPGDLFYIFTDGIPEATGRDGQQFGMERLEQLIVEKSCESKGDAITVITDKITGSLDDFTGFDRPTDDITFIIGRYISPQKEDKSKAIISKKDKKVTIKKID
jgi:serine phosphatase RsbU (regulator of sigma subunit)/anti-sigma regulatory factor (Ser/Thr protein kinase)